MAACLADRWRIVLDKWTGAVVEVVTTKAGWAKRAMRENTGEVGDRVVIPYRCGSWRCRRCRDFARRRDFVRIEAALERQNPKDVLFLVLTLDPKRNGLADPFEGFERMCSMWKLFAQTLRRELGGFEGYVSTVEVHASGRPHLNVILVSKALAAGLRGKHPSQTVEALKRAALAAGFGYSLSAEVPRSMGALTSYIVKTAGETEDRIRQRAEAARTVGEVTKLSQLPVNAPPHFRRLRSSPGFLPPVVRSLQWTGRLEFAPPSAEVLEAAKAAELAKSEEKAKRMRRIRGARTEIQHRAHERRKRGRRARLRKRASSE